jgi:hypothetical protein
LVRLALVHGGVLTRWARPLLWSIGDSNWYLPKWLQWLPRLEHEAAPVATPVPTAA